MTLFHAMPEKCIQCGICAKECPMRIIEFGDYHSLPQPSADAEELCIRCGHCVAVCPEGAFKHEDMFPEQCPTLNNESRFDIQQMEYLLRSRRSIRSYKKKHVDRKVFKNLVDLARYAPSAHNLQPVRWLIIYDNSEAFRLAGLAVDWMRNILEEKPIIAQRLHIDRILVAWESGIDDILHGGPHVIITHAAKEIPEASSACIIALAYLELAAPSFGLGTCWAGFFNLAANSWPPLIKALGIPKGHSSFGSMIVGFPEYKYSRIPIRNRAKIKWV